MTSATFSTLQFLNYQDGLFLTASLLSTEQANLLDVTSFQNRGMFSSGVITGLEVTSTTAKQLNIATGFALNYLGNPLSWPANAQAVPVSVTDVTGYLVCLQFPTQPQSSGSFYLYLPTVSVISPTVASSNPAYVPIASISVDANGNITVDASYSAPKCTLLIPVQSQTSATSAVESVQPTADVNAVAPETAEANSAESNAESAANAAAVSTPAAATQTTPLSGAGTIQVTPSSTRKIFPSVSFFYKTDNQAAFTDPPLVMLTVQTLGQDQALYAATVSNVTNAQFTVTLTNLSPITTSGPVQINWAAWTVPA